MVSPVRLKLSLLTARPKSGCSRRLLATTISPLIYTDAKIAEIHKSRHKVISTVIETVPLQATLLERARHYYVVRNKLIHERATITVPQVDIENYRRVIEEILTRLFGLQF